MDLSAFFDSRQRIAVLDTETTGRSAASGDKIVEIGIVVLEEGLDSERVTHHQWFVDPEREVPDDAVEVHGITREIARERGHGKTFRDIAHEVLDVVRDSLLVIHNAEFDVGFLNAELRQADPAYGEIGGYVAGVFCSLMVARVLRPSKRNTLDALCRHYGVDSSGRDLHGALLDAELLSGVFQKLLAERRARELTGPSGRDRFAATLRCAPIERPSDEPLPVVTPSPDERAEHLRIMERLRGVDDTLDWAP